MLNLCMNLYMKFRNFILDIIRTRTISPKKWKKTVVIRKIMRIFLFVFPFLIYLLTAFILWNTLDMTQIFRIIFIVIAIVLFILLLYIIFKFKALVKDYITDEYIEHFKNVGLINKQGNSPIYRKMKYYSRDISKKRRLSNFVKGNAGEPLALPPYGYMKDPDNPKNWIIDEEPAKIVRRIYNEFLGGKGTEQIAEDLTADQILTPMNYWASIGLNRGGLRNTENPSFWNSSTIVKILTLQEYVGDVINFKTYSKSYKLKKRLKNKPEDMVVFKDVHEPIISREDFERVKEKRRKTRKRKTSNGETSIFSGLLTCADCGSNMNYHFNQKNPDIKYFNCSSNNKRGSCPQTHYIRVDFLEQVIIQEIRRLTKFATQYEKQFAEVIMGNSKLSAEKNITADTFIFTVRKYTRVKKLTRQMLNELIDEIKINHAEKLANGETVQIITIYWNCIGTLEIPDLPKIPDVDVTVNTRKGVNVKYAPKLSA